MSKLINWGLFFSDAVPKPVPNTQHHFSWDYGTQFCCGVREYGQFVDELQTWYLHETANTKAELYRNVFARMIKRDICRPEDHDDDDVDDVESQASFGHIWFVKHKGSKKYEFEELKKLFATSEKVWNLGSYTNPNTSNRIQGYGFKLER